MRLIPPSYAAKTDCPRTAIGDSGLSPRIEFRSAFEASDPMPVSKRLHSHLTFPPQCFAIGRRSAELVDIRMQAF
jgi:hypothetical protein